MKDIIVTLIRVPWCDAPKRDIENEMEIAVCKFADETGCKIYDNEGNIVYEPKQQMELL